MDEREAKLLADNIYKALRPGFMAVIITMMRAVHQLDPKTTEVFPPLEYQRQAHALLLDAERFYQ